MCFPLTVVSSSFLFRFSGVFIFTVLQHQQEMEHACQVERTLAERYHTLASVVHDRPVVARRSTVPALITLLVSAYPDVRRIAAETIFMLCDHPQNPVFLVDHTNLLQAIRDELSIAREQQQQQPARKGTVAEDCSPEHDNDEMLWKMEQETLEFLQQSHSILEETANACTVGTPDGGSNGRLTSSPQARPVLEGEAATERCASAVCSDVPVTRRPGWLGSSLMSLRCKALEWLRWCVWNPLRYWCSWAATIAVRHHPSRSSTRPASTSENIL